MVSRNVDELILEFLQLMALILDLAKRFGAFQFFTFRTPSRLAFP